MLNEVWATPIYSPLELSQELSRLKVSHSLASLDRTQKDILVNCRRAQPRWVFVSHSIFKLCPSSINLISASYAELSMTNFPRFPDLDLRSALKHVLTAKKVTKTEVIRLSPLDFVNSIVQPSLLNKIQTEYYRIQPYALRKDAEALIFQFFRTEISHKTAITFLQKSLKTEALIPLLEEGLFLRDAVTRILLNHEDVEALAEETGISSFDLMYLTRERKPKAK